MPLPHIEAKAKTAEGVIISGDAMKQELFYVAASRGRSEIAIVTSDRQLLRESLGISAARPSATELAKELGRSQNAPRAPRRSFACSADRTEDTATRDPQWL
jgi:hypothetical protein